MRNIVIVDALSTGYNYIEDVYRRGYKPVELQTKRDTDEVRSDRAGARRNRYRDPLTLVEDQDYGKTLEMVRALDPVIVIPGAESGVVLANNLAYDLGLKGNPRDIIPAMTQKPEMHEALRKAGLRYIRGRKVTNADEALAFCRENGLSCAVVKPIESAASVGLHLCDDLNEVEAAVNSLIGQRTMFGDLIDEVIIQERIRGTEYIVNTASSDGFHRLTSIFRYSKKVTEEGGNIYDFVEAMTHMDPCLQNLVDYALKVADAIGYRYGAIHGEYMIDENGPVLIEVNCRPMGNSLPGEFMDLAYGQHETNTVLDAYLDPEKFRRDALAPFRPKRKIVIKIIMVPRDTDVENHPLWIIAKQLRSTYKVTATDENQQQFYAKTVDLETSGGNIYLINDDEDAVMSDLHLLQLIEKDYFQLLFNEGTSRKWFIAKNEAPINFQDIICRNGACGSILVAKDEYSPEEGAQVVTPDNLDDAHKGFDYCIIGYQKSLIDRNESELLKLMFETMDKVREGGKVIIPEAVYKYLSYGKRGAEMLLYIKRFLIEPPKPCNCGDVVGAYEKI